MRPDLHIELGGGAVLRPYTSANADALYALVDANRVRLARWFHWVDDATDAASQAAYIESRVDDGRSLDGNGIWVGDDLAGGCDLMIAGSDDVGELGFWLDEAFVGRGLVTRAAQALMATGYESERLHRIQLRAGVDNLRSRAVAKRLGMREEGTWRDGIRVADGYLDSVGYGILEDEWRARRVPT